MARLNEGVLAPDDPKRAADGDSAVFKDGALLLDQITTIDKALLRDYIGRVRTEKIEEIECALRQQLGMQG